MERSLVKHGESTLMVSIPSGYIKRMQLGKGDRMDVIDLGDHIRVQPRVSPKTKVKQRLDFKEPNYDVIRAMLCKLVRAGADEITVGFDSEETMKLIHEITSSIFGYEVVETYQNHCVVKNLVNQYDLTIGVTMKRIISLTSHGLEIVRQRLKGDKTLSADNLRLIRDEAWKFKDAAYSISHHDTMQNSFPQYYIIHIYEQNVTYLYWIMKYLDQSGIARISNEVITLFDKTIQYYERSITMMKQPDEKYIKFILSTRRSLMKECEALAAKGGSSAPIAIYLSILIQNIHNPKSVLVA